MAWMIVLTGSSHMDRDVAGWRSEGADGYLHQTAEAL